MIAGSINICGAFGGNMSPGNRYNAKGMFENARIRNTITKPYLRQLGLDPLGQYPLPNTSNLVIPTDWRKRVEQVLIEEGYKGGPIFYKGAKICLFWPVWHYAFPHAKWVIVRRRSGDVANSCLKTGFMRAFQNKDIQRSVGVDNERDGWLWWVNHHLQMFRDMMDAGLNCHIIWPERMVNGDYSQLMELIEWCSLPWKSEVLSFIDPRLWKSRQK